MAEAIHRRPAVEKMLGLSRSTIYAKLADPDDDFPRPIQLGKRAVGWREADLMAWLEAREAA